MNDNQENYEPAPIEFMHDLIMKLFHEHRESMGDHSDVRITGGDLNKIIAQSKTETYKKYPKQVSSKGILKTEI